MMVLDPRRSPAISVVITNYNYERFVATAIQSVLRQSRPADQVIVVDDGSTDQSRSVIRSFADRVELHFQCNEGVRSVYNTGFELSRGDLTLFLDSDDALYEEALQMLENAFAPGIAKIQFDLDVIDGFGAYTGRRYCNFAEGYTSQCVAAEFAASGHYIWPVTSGNAYARHFMSKVMPLTPPVSHDGVLNTIAPLYGAVVTIPRPLGQYRVHTLNISRSDLFGVVNMIPDFPLRIAIRQEEFEELRRHAALTGTQLPDGDLLDSDPVFANYRIMARKLGKEQGPEKTRPLPDLWLTGVRAITAQRFRKGMLKHIVWLTSVALAPSWLARRLIWLRYHRTYWLALVRQRYRHWLRCI